MLYHFMLFRIPPGNTPHRRPSFFSRKQNCDACAPLDEFYHTIALFLVVEPYPANFTVVSVE
eukprot:1803518-Pyramimonas_sp.AAC.1